MSFTIGRARTAAAVAAIVALVVACLLADGALRPAAAETPAGDTESFVTSVEPPTRAIDVAVLGGDETLRITVAPGHEVVVRGYLGEPYLRIDPGGDVFENRRSPAVDANADRYNTAAASGSADAGAEPDWSLVGTGGRAEWHDHRMHWMTEAVPVPGDPGDLVFGWTVDLTVDASPVVVTGELRRGEASSPWPWFALAAAVAAITSVVGFRRRAGSTVVVASAAIVTLIAVGVSIGEQVALECWTCRPLDVVPVVAAVVATVVSTVARRRGVRLTAASIALVALTGWLLVHLRVLTHSVVVSAWPAPLVRTAVAIALGLAVAGLVAAAVEGRRALDAYASRPPSRRGPSRSRTAITSRTSSGHRS